MRVHAQIKSLTWFHTIKLILSPRIMSSAPVLERHGVEETIISAIVSIFAQPASTRSGQNRMISCHDA